MVMLGSTAMLNFKDSHFSLTSDTIYDLYAVDQVEEISGLAGSMTDTSSGDSPKPGKGNSGGKRIKK